MMSKLRQFFRRNREETWKEYFERLDAEEQRVNLEHRKECYDRIKKRIQAHDLALFVLGRLALKNGMSEIEFSEYWSNSEIYAEPLKVKVK